MTRALPAGLLLGALLFPIYWMVAASVTPEARLFEARPLLPSTITLDHYRALFDARDF
jgi:ABC-type glycerol-3-phosphate transport system permease component